MEYRLYHCTYKDKYYIESKDCSKKFNWILDEKSNFKSNMLLETNKYKILKSIVLSQLGNMFDTN